MSSRKRRLITVGVAAAVLTIAMTASAPGVSIRKLVKKEVAKQIANATGPAGATGAQGPAGTNGATNVTVREGNPVTLLNTQSGTSTAACQGNDRATGGGYTEFTGNGAVQTNRPDPGVQGQTPTGWVVAVTNNSGATLEFRAYVICAAP